MRSAPRRRNSSSKVFMRTGGSAGMKRSGTRPKCAGASPAPTIPKLRRSAGIISRGRLETSGIWAQGRLELIEGELISKAGKKCVEPVFVVRSKAQSRIRYLDD